MLPGAVVEVTVSFDGLVKVAIALKLCIISDLLVICSKALVESEGYPELVHPELVHPDR